MDERKDFIETLQTTIRDLQNEGIITSEQLKEKLEVPIEWFFSNGIDRRILSKTFDNICRKVNSIYPEKPKRSYAIDTIRILERNGKIEFQILGRDNWTIFSISNESSHTQGKIQTFNSDEFIEEFQSVLRESQQERIQDRLGNLSRKEIQDIFKVIYDQKQQYNETKGLSIALSEMVENFGEYYRYLYKEKEKTAEQEIEVTSGGLIEQDVDSMPFTGTRGKGEGEKTERVNEIYPFEERDNIFRQLKPMQIISFDSIDENRQVQRGTYTSYVFQNKRENGGYFLISEPYRGDKSCRAVYISEEDIKNFVDGEENPNFWVDIARTYLEMSTQEFHDEKSTYTFKHRELEPYAARMQYIISNEINPNVSKSIIYSAKMNLSKLFGIEINRKRLEKIAEGASREEIEEARTMITPRTQEKSGGGREE